MQLNQAPGQSRRHPLTRHAGAFAAISLAIASVAGGWLALSLRATASPGPEAVAAAFVSTDRIEMRDRYQLTRAFVGQLEPAQRTDLAFELAGTIAQVLVEEGDTVEAGQPIALLDTELLQAERRRVLASLEAMSAQARLAALTDERQRALQARGFVSAQAGDTTALGLVEITARIAEVEASLAEIDIRIEKARIRAPFAGRVAARHLDQGSNARPGLAVVSLVENGDPLFRVGIAPSALQSLPAEGSVEILLDGIPHRARLHAILPELDAATRTRTVLLRLIDADLPAFRTTGTLLLAETIMAEGAWIPVSALAAGPRAVWQIQVAVADRNDLVIANESVEILFATADMAYVRGSFTDDAIYVVDGTHRVVPGQRIRVSEPTD